MSLTKGVSLVQTKYGDTLSLKRVNQYLLVCTLGEGSFAKVFLGRSEENGETREFAIKRIHLNELARSPAGITQLEREIQIMRRLDCPYIVHLIEAIHVPERDTAYIVIEYADCQTLSRAMNQEYRFKPSEIRAIFAQIALGVQYLHRHDIVHQDLKPSNVLMKSNGQVMISDFGIGHSFQSAAMVVGTPSYQAPEVIDEGFADEEDDPGKEDIWSLGVTLFELVFGDLPYGGNNLFEIVRTIVTTPLEKPPGVDNSLWELIQGMLTVDPGQRFSISEVCEHPYVKNADITQSPHLQPFTPPPIPEGIPVVQINGTICNKNYSFVMKRSPPKLMFKAPFG